MHYKTEILVTVLLKIDQYQFLGNTLLTNSYLFKHYRRSKILADEG